MGFHRWWVFKLKSQGWLMSLWWLHCRPFCGLQLQENFYLGGQRRVHKHKHVMVHKEEANMLFRREFSMALKRHRHDPQSPTSETCTLSKEATWFSESS